MAKNQQVNIGVSVETQQALRSLDALREKTNKLTEDLKKLSNKLKDSSTWGPTDTKSSLEAQFQRKQKELEKAASDYQYTAQRIKGIDSTLEEISGASYDTLTRLRTTLTSTLKRRKLCQQAWIQITITLSQSFLNVKS